MDGNPVDIPSGASSITVSGEVELSGEIGVDIIVEESEEPGKETVVTIPENSNTTLKSGVTITLKSNTSMDILGTLDGDADSVKLDSNAENVDVNAEDPESVESVVSSEIEVGIPGVTNVKTAEEFIAALGDSRTTTIVLSSHLSFTGEINFRVMAGTIIDGAGFKIDIQMVGHYSNNSAFYSSGQYTVKNLTLNLTEGTSGIAFDFSNGGCLVKCDCRSEALGVGCLFELNYK